MAAESLDGQIGHTRICYNNDVIMTIWRHIKNPGIVRTVQGNSAIFTDVQSYWGISRHIKTYSDIIEACGAIMRHMRNSA